MKRPPKTITCLPLPATVVVSEDVEFSFDEYLPAGEYEVYAWYCPHGPTLEVVNSLGHRCSVNYHHVSAIKHGDVVTTSWEEWEAIERGELLPKYGPAADAIRRMSRSAE